MQHARCIAALAVCLTVLLSSCVRGSLDMSLQNACESPSMPAGAMHVVIAGYEEHTCFTHYIWNMGLTNARVFLYRRLTPEKPLSVWHGPCGVRVEERLLLPNHGRELAAFMDHAVEFYDQPPTALLFLHGHGPHGWHTDCETIVGRARLFYRGLVGKHTGTEDAEFARHMVTLTRFGYAEDPPWMQRLMMDPTILSREGPRAQERRSLKGEESSEMEHARLCAALLTKWGVNSTSAGFYSAGATFILPWQRIQRYPRGFYEEGLAYARNTSTDATWTGRYCFENTVYFWFQEPKLSPSMKKLYARAASIASQYDLSSCAGSSPANRC